MTDHVLCGTAGDRLLKRYVVAMPDLEEQQLSSQDDALILASDGLWDVLSNEDAAGLIRDIKVTRNSLCPPSAVILISAG